MKRILVFLLIFVISGLTAAAEGEADKGKPKVTPLSTRDVAEKVDGKQVKATTVEVTLEPGQASMPHRHPGPVFGYIIEGTYEWAIDAQPARTLKAGDTFYEPTLCLHRVSRNPGTTRTRLVARALRPALFPPLRVRSRRWFVRRLVFRSVAATPVHEVHGPVELREQLT